MHELCEQRERELSAAWAKACEERDRYKRKRDALVEELKRLQAAVQYSINMLDSRSAQAQVAGDLAVNVAASKDFLSTIKD